MTTDLNFRIRPNHLPRGIPRLHFAEVTSVHIKIYLYLESHLKVDFRSNL